MMQFGDARLPDRFWAKCMPEPMSGCWIWTASGANSPSQYGEFVYFGRRQKAHRVTYETDHGAVKAGLELDHKCRQRSCCNPAHLEPVTRIVNITRGVGPALTAARYTTPGKCPEGHDRIPVPKHWNRTGHYCPACIREGAARYAKKGSHALPATF